MDPTTLLAWTALAALALVWIGGGFAAIASARRHGLTPARTAIGCLAAPLWPLLAGYWVWQQIVDDL